MKAMRKSWSLPVVLAMALAIFLCMTAVSFADDGDSIGFGGNYDKNGLFISMCG
ncbi:MAG: hypothetical protein IJ128_01730 [Firmicutes bacterium]|nr:hypothetical protein [Bacillota bacterium]